MSETQFKFTYKPVPFVGPNMPFVDFPQTNPKCPAKYFAMKRIRQSAFTIIELMLTVAISSVLLAVAVPAYKDLVMNNCLTTKTNGMVSAMQLARSTAITLRDNVSVGALDCRMDEDNNGAADGACTASDEFGAGVVVFRDIDGDGLADTLIEDLNGDGVLDVGEDLNGNGRLDTELVKLVRFSCAATINETGNQTAIKYSLKGSAANTAVIDVCDNRDSATYEGRQLALSLTGRPKTDSHFTCP
ncbi:MAG: GspH/FimT family pseudopilin [Proteobacteria bacterium]|nr:GspH/FimT family pseudopilin [Pseudomonadota bacterium]